MKAWCPPYVFLPWDLVAGYLIRCLHVPWGKYLSVVGGVYYCLMSLFFFELFLADLTEFGLRGEFHLKSPCYSVRKRSLLVLGERGSFGEMMEYFLWPSGRKLISPAVRAQNSGVEAMPTYSNRKKKVTEHIFLLKVKQDLVEYEEKEMLDYLYTFQYHMKGVVAISLGQIAEKNSKRFTHVVFMRFQRKEDLARFYDNSFSGVLKEHVMPYCHGLIAVDFEAEVEDDILSIFHRGEDFNYGVEFMLLLQVVQSEIGEHVEDALATLANLTVEFRSLIVQATQVDALELFRHSSEYKNMWRSKFQPPMKSSVEVYFRVDPVGTDIM